MSVLFSLGKQFSRFLGVGFLVAIGFAFLHSPIAHAAYYDDPVVYTTLPDGSILATGGIYSAWYKAPQKDSFGAGLGQACIDKGYKTNIECAKNIYPDKINPFYASSFSDSRSGMLFVQRGGAGKYALEIPKIFALYPGGNTTGTDCVLAINLVDSAAGTGNITAIKAQQAGSNIQDSTCPGYMSGSVTGQLTMLIGSSLQTDVNSTSKGLRIAIDTSVNSDNSLYGKAVPSCAGSPPDNACITSRSDALNSIATTCEEQLRQNTNDPCSSIIVCLRADYTKSVAQCSASTLTSDQCAASGGGACIVDTTTTDAQIKDRCSKASDVAKQTSCVANMTTQRAAMIAGASTDSCKANPAAEGCKFDTTKADPSCTAGPLGWIICGLIKTISTVNDGIFAILQQWLFINPVALSTEPGKDSLYTTWKVFRDVANIAFIIALMIVIFSQATSVGLSSYGIKKMLPKIIVSIILVNLSFFICKFAVDISNIIGGSIGGFFDAGIKAISSGRNFGNLNAISWDGLVTALITGGAATGVIFAAISAGGGWAALAMLLPFVVTALFAVVTTFLVVMVRQAVLILLVVLSPLAFVAYILPNTEKWFDKWKDTFATVLFLYPLIALLFSGSKLAAWVIISSGMSTNPADGISPSLMFIALIITFIPLFAVPWLIKVAGGVLGRFGGMINNPNKGPFDALRKRAEGVRDTAGNNAKANALKNFSATNGGRPPKWYSRGFGASAYRTATKNYRQQQSATNLQNAQTAAVGNALTANQSYARAVAGGKQASAEDVTRAIAAGLGALNEIEAKNLKAAQTVLADAHLDGKSMFGVMDGTNFQDRNGNTIQATPFMQKAAMATFMEQGRQIDDVAKKFAFHKDKDMRDFFVGQVQSNYSKVKERQAGYTDEALLENISNGSITTQTQLDTALVASSGKVAKTLNVETFATQEAISLNRIMAHVLPDVKSGVITADTRRILDVAKQVERTPGARAKTTGETAPIITSIGNL